MNTIEADIAAGKIVAKLEQAPHTGAWRMPTFFYSLEGARRRLAESKESYPSMLWRLSVLENGQWKVIA